MLETGIAGHERLFLAKWHPKAEKKLRKRPFFDSADRHEKLYGRSRLYASAQGRHETGGVLSLFSSLSFDISIKNSMQRWSSDFQGLFWVKIRKMGQGSKDLSSSTLPLTSVAKQGKIAFVHGLTVWKSPIIDIAPATFHSESAVLTTCTTCLGLDMVVSFSLICVCSHACRSVQLWLVFRQWNRLLLCPFRQWADEIRRYMRCRITGSVPSSGSSQQSKNDHLLERSSGGNYWRRRKGVGKRERNAWVFGLFNFSTLLQWHRSPFL